MKADSRKIIKTYLALMLSSTFASSFIWGINTLFLLDAGLSITEAFAANAFFTAGQVLFEVPTGVVADTMGRRISYLMGTIALLAATLVYLLLWQIGADFWLWAASSAFLGLGFTFFSGATEAWLVDALHASGYKGSLDGVFAKGQVAGGIAMLSGSIMGGFVAQLTNLGVPYILRCVMLGVTFFIALAMMRDIGFKARRSATVSKEVRTVLKSSWRYGFGTPSVRWMMLTGPFTAGVLFYVFYAMQPYLLELYGQESYAVAGLAAAIVAGAQIAGGFTVPFIRKLFTRRTNLLMTTTVLSVVTLALIGLTSSFWVALLLLVVWGTLFAASTPVRLAYLNALIPSKQRATLLSSDNLLSSAGAAATQPGLGRIAEVHGYPASYLASAGLNLLALPFIILANRTNPPSDKIEQAKAS